MRSSRFQDSGGRGAAHGSHAPPSQATIHNPRSSHLEHLQSIYGLPLLLLANLDKRSLQTATQAAQSCR